ncbi:hypothetical protein BE17_37575 [Sorangium cellulosum]|uniref:Tryptophan synthase beta chain-like PALP domain-containing protein n=1 Tax=Sorangium cellulosum TaxID=56 RepID=A0A150R4I3_SORCE|nr:hypothetical protein BE17_37575 [Sorangium cellulosum]
MVEQVLRRGTLAPGVSLLAATSGNFGVALAWIGKAHGRAVEICLPEDVGNDTLALLRNLGVNLVTTPAHLGTDGAILTALDRARANPERYHYVDQFDDDDNPRAHYLSTAEEIVRQTGGAEFDCFVAGLGSTGTFMGISRRLQELNPDLRCVACQPEGSECVRGLGQLIPGDLPRIYEPHRPREVLSISQGSAREMARVVALEEGLHVGASSGAALAACFEVARRMEAAGARRARILTVFPDFDARINCDVWQTLSRFKEDR